MNGTFLKVLASAALIAPLGAVAQAQDASFDLKIGVVAGLTGDPGPDGQGWNEAAMLGVKEIQKSIERLGLSNVKVTFTDSQDSQGTAQAAVEAGQKLVNVDGVNVIVGDFWSGATSALATAVTIPNNVVIFTGGTNPALTKLNEGLPVSLVWQPVAADDIQGKALAFIMGQEFGTDATVNIAARNDGYGTALSAVFAEAWKAAGGTVGETVIYNADQPTLDTEAQKVVEGSPDAWLFVDFCQTFEKLAQSLSRTGKWDAAKSFGGDALNDCGLRGSKNYPGFRATQANASAGASFPAFKALFEKDAKQGVAFQAFLAESFDSPFIAFLAALKAKSADPTKIAGEIVAITNDPGEKYTFEQLDDAIKAVMDGKDIHFVGATGDLNFSPDGRVNALAYDIWQHQPDGTSKMIKTVQYTPN